MLGKNRWKTTYIIALVMLAAIFFTACSNDTKDTEANKNTPTDNNETETFTSKLDGVSDEVYQELVEYYFFLTTQMSIILDETDSEDKPDSSWYKDHALYAKASAYADAHEEDIYLLNVFPNPLLYEYNEDPANFSIIEQEYIETMFSYFEAVNRANIKDYTEIKEELQTNLEIDDADNIFTLK